MRVPTVDDCQIIQLPKIPDYRGNLTYIEGARHIPFRIARAYWIYDVPGDAVRGGHAYQGLHEFVVSLSGSFEVRVDDGTSKRTFVLNRSYYGLYVPPLIWRQLVEFATNSVCLIVASDHFSETDYIRHYDAFLELRGGGPC